MELLTSDASLVIFAALGLAVTGVTIVSDARAMRARTPVRPRPVDAAPRAVEIEPSDLAA